MAEKIKFRCLEAPEIRKAGEGEGRKMTFVASDGTRDSAHTVLNQDGWDLKRFNKNGVIGYQHDVYYNDDPDKVIGKGRAYTGTDSKGEKCLLLDVEFEPDDINPLAGKVYKKLKFGTLKAVSVGFRPLGKGSFGQGEEAIGGKNETYYYAGQELLEVSVVNIPANPNALKRGIEEEEKELEELRKEALADQNPAPEPEPEPAPEPETKDLNAQEVAARRQALANAEIMARAALLK